jgi:hypothetical protein
LCDRRRKFPNRNKSFLPSEGRELRGWSIFGVVRELWRKISENIKKLIMIVTLELIERKDRESRRRSIPEEISYCVLLYNGCNKLS